MAKSPLRGLDRGCCFDGSPEEQPANGNLVRDGNRLVGRFTRQPGTRRIPMHRNNVVAL